MTQRFVPTLQRLLALLSALAAVHGVFAQSSIPDADESQVRAMMLVNLTKFIDWPVAHAESHPPFVICATENDSVSADLEAILANTTIQGSVVQFRRGVSPDQAEACQLLYVAHLKRNTVVDPSGALTNASVLTVSGDHLSRSGSTIALPMVDGRIQIEVDRGRAQRAHLTLSSHLLQIAVNSR